MSEIEPAVVAHETNDGVELTVYELSVVADDCNADNGDALAVLMIDFRDRDVESALEPPDDALDNAPLFLERCHALQR